MIPLVIVKQLEKYLAGVFGNNSRIEDCRHTGGGSINEVCAFTCNQKKFFVKWNTAAQYPGMFETEAKGLALLASSHTFRIPEVLSSGSADPFAFLLLEFVSSGSATKPFWEESGRTLAVLHRHTNPRFGLNHDNFIGSLPQANSQCDDWVDFYIQMRLEPQIRLAHNNARADASLSRSFDRLFQRLVRLFPVEPPSLLHGDLWSGNLMCDNNQKPVLIDPAVYYGHREMDLAMTALFGGFHQDFYDAYNRAWPLEQGWEERVGLCNLYPLMVHVNLFGGSYLSQVNQILKRFAG